jgi:DNA-binding GntR family transcriptional regulator
VVAAVSRTEENRNRAKNLYGIPQVFADAHEMVQRVRPDAIYVFDLNSRRLEEIYEVRIRLEGWAAGRAARRMTPEATTRIRAILDKMDRPNISVAEWLELNWEFHDSLYACAGQEFLRKMISNLRLTLESYLRLDLAKVADYAPGRREHRRIFQACLRGDAKGAERHTVAHLRRVARGLVMYLRRYGK